MSREIYVPVHNVLAIYANENGQGMAFEVSGTAADAPPSSGPEAVLSSVPSLSSVPGATPDNAVAEVASSSDDDTEPPKKGGRPTLTRIK